jgi:ribose 5-phosphate isomerase A
MDNPSKMNKELSPMNQTGQTQDELKTLVAQAALNYVVPGEYLGVGTGSTVNLFIDALAASGIAIKAAVSSSIASTQRLQSLGVPVVDLTLVSRMAVYIDGADEIDANGFMVKGGGAALTREKIVAAQADRFVCIADASKRVEVLGTFPLPVEVIPMAAPELMRQFSLLGGQAKLRMVNDQAFVTDNGQHLLDVVGLRINDPLGFEIKVSQWPGVVTVGVFAHQRAHVCLLGTTQGVQTLVYD